MFTKQIDMHDWNVVNFYKAFDRQLKEIASEVGKEPINVIPIDSHIGVNGRVVFYGLVLFPGSEQ